VVVAEQRKDAPEGLAQAVKDHVKSTLGLSVHEVVLVPPGGLPKTSSGKLQRRKTASVYATGELGKEDRTLGSNAARVTVARHVTRSLVARIRHRVKKVLMAPVTLIRGTLG
jgi:hypothetical protein